MIPALKFLMYPNAMTDKFYLEEAIEDLHTLLDMTRWATSRFNDAALYFGHGTDNAWDEATSLVMQALHLPHPILEQVGDSVMTSRLTKSEREKRRGEGKVNSLSSPGGCSTRMSAHKLENSCHVDFT